MKIQVETKGHYDFVDLTKRINNIVKKSGVEDGMVFLFVRGSTAVLTTMEYESGLLEDLKQVFEGIAPESADYRHHLRWGDKNGAAHIKSAFIGPDLAIPIEKGKMQLGTWQQIVLVDFDERPRTREIIVKIGNLTGF